MPAITTHVLDTSTGRPLPDLPLTLEVFIHENWQSVAVGSTNGDGRCRVLEAAELGRYRLTFTLPRDAFYPEIAIQFVVSDHRDHHVPLLLNPFGYTTYRGS